MYYYVRYFDRVVSRHITLDGARRKALEVIYDTGSNFVAVEDGNKDLYDVFTGKKIID